MLVLVWMVITAPMKKESSATIPMLLIPSRSISSSVLRQYTRNRSGRLKVSFSKWKYCPI
jgi:hypothetical protein